MQVDVRVYGSLRDLLPREKKGRTTLTLPTGAVAGDVLDALGIDFPILLAVNDAHESERGTELTDGDRVILFEFTAGG